VAYARVSLVNQMLFTAAAALFSNLALKDRKTPWKFTSLILFFFLLELIISGNRIFLALYLLAFLTSAWSYGRKKIMVALVLSSPVLALAFSLWAAVRSDFGKASDDSQASKAYELDVGNTTVTHLMGVTEGSAIMLLMHFINDFGAKFDYLYGGTYARPFTLVIPRSICPVRPPDMTTLAAQLYEPGESTSLGSTAMGEAYANFGAVSICVLPLLTFFAAWCSRRLCVNADKHNLMSTVSFIMFIGFVRFPFAENAITWVATLFMIWLFRLDQRLVRHDFRRGAMLLGTHGPSPDPSPLAGA
jgi:oligosaccharide repeat unit polymerase